MDKMKVSDWLSATVDSHDILEHDGLAKDFHEKTGFGAVWPAHTVEGTRRAIERRGVGGHVNGEPAQLMAWGYEVAQSLAQHHAPGYTCTKMGRGFIFHEALDAIKRAGK